MCYGEEWVDVDFVYAEKLQHGHNLNAKSHLRIILDARSVGKVFFFFQRPSVI